MNCSIVDCERGATRRGWCSKHYDRWRRNGDPELSLRPTYTFGTVEERFWAKVDKSRGENGCWLWTAGRFTNGYGQFGLTPAHPVQAHRLAYELQVGPIPEGLTIDHLCRVPLCQNAKHMEPVTLLFLGGVMVAGSLGAFDE